MVLGIEPRTLSMIGKCSANELTSPAQDMTFKVFEFLDHEILKGMLNFILGY